MAGAPRVLYPPGMEWEVMVQRPHHLLREAAGAGWRVVWCEVGPYRKPVEVLPNLWVVRDLQSMADFAPYDLAYITDPLQLKYIDSRIRPRLTIYDRCDPRGEREQKLLGQADLVLATTPSLLEEARRYAKRTLLVPNAADPVHFEAGIKRARGERPVIGYMGVLAAHLDYRLLAELIEARPDWCWLFAGREKGAVKLPGASNVRRLGHVPYAELPRFLQQLDVALVPFLDTPHTRIVESVKIFEYMAAGKQVVATRLPPLEQRDWPVRLAAGTGQWLEALASALAAGPFNEAARAWAEAHTWRHRFDRVRLDLNDLLTRR